MVDIRPKVLGRGLTQTVRHPRYKGPHHLWNHVAPPPVQNSVVVWKDGSVTEGTDFGPEVFGSPNLHYVVQGGHDYRCSDLDTFTLAALMTAGYECRDDTLDLYAPDDKHSDVYPRVDSESMNEARMAALRDARLARIADLERELNVLRGLAP